MPSRHAHLLVRHKKTDLVLQLVATMRQESLDFDGTAAPLKAWQEETSRRWEARSLLTRDCGWSTVESITIVPVACDVD
jgi:hypothetical protein